MLQLSPQTRILVAVEPVDFRKGIDGLCQLCRAKLLHDPMSGAVFVFCNRRRHSIRILVYDGQGFWLCTKRLSQGRLTWWPRTNEVLAPIVARELHILLWNGNPDQAQLGEDWRVVA